MQLFVQEAGLESPRLAMPPAEQRDGNKAGTPPGEKSQAEKAAERVVISPASKQESVEVLPNSSAVSAPGEQSAHHSSTNRLRSPSLQSQTSTVQDVKVISEEKPPAPQSGVSSSTLPAELCSVLINTKISEDQR